MVNKFCRICLGVGTFNIFNAELPGGMKYSEMMNICSDLKVQPDDGLPENICQRCVKRVEKCHDLRLLCHDSDIKLRECSLKQLLACRRKKLKLHPQNYGDIFPVTCYIRTELEQESGLISSDIENIKKELKVKQEESEHDILDNAATPSMCDGREDEEIPADRDSHDSPLVDFSNDYPVKLEGEEKSTKSMKSSHQCDICGKILSTKSNMLAHRVCHMEHRPYKCEQCNAAFKAYSALYQHKKKHSGVTPYHCEHCPRQFSRRTAFVNHVKLHTGERNYACGICPKTFIQSTQLTTHMRRHKGDRTFVCQHCGKGFTIKSDLQVHTRLHTGEKPYACHICPKTFVTSGNLSVHVRIHNKEIRYNCTECNRGFVTCTAFQIHMKRHRQQKDYKCECGKDFYTSSALKQHKVVHTGEKKYICKICDRKFTQSGHLSRHTKKDHLKSDPQKLSSSKKKIPFQRDYTTGGENVIISNSFHVLSEEFVEKSDLDMASLTVIRNTNQLC